MSIRPLTLVAAAGAFATFAYAAQAQETSMTVDGITVSAGGGFNYIKLPEVRFIALADPTVPIVVRHQKNSDFDETGGAFSGEISAPIGYWGGKRVTGAVRGFVAGANDSDVTTCLGTATLVCGGMAPSGGPFFGEQLFR